MREKPSRPAKSHITSLEGDYGGAEGNYLTNFSSSAVSLKLDRMNMVFGTIFGLLISKIS